MKQSFPVLSGLFVVAVFSLLLLCCSKPAFKSGKGLYSLKQYHVYSVLSPGDTVKLADARINLSAENNNYLLWNGITFHVMVNTDSIATYIKDSLVGGTTYQVLYTLTYLPKTDKITVTGNTNDNKIWRSF